MTRISVQIIPNASASEIASHEGSTWRIRLQAPPIEGKANLALVRFLSDRLQLAPRHISILSGHTSRRKILNVPLDEETIQERLSLS